MLAITGLAPPSALRKTLIRSSVPSRVGTSTSRSMTTSAGGSVTVIGGLATPRTRSSTATTRRAPSEQLKFLRDALAGSSGSRSVRLEVREDRDTITAVREETQWPLAGTRWRPMYLAGPGLLATEPPPTAGSIRFQTRSRAAAFNWTIPEDIELTGPMAARLWVQLDGCDDANLFVGVEKWRDGQFVAFEGSYGWGRDRVTTGWQRVSLRELDPELSQPWEPVPACARPRPVTAGEVVAVDVALGPSATLFRAGEQLRLVVGGRWLSPRNPLTGQFPAAYPRPPRGRVTLHWGPRYDAHLLIPEVPG